MPMCRECKEVVGAGQVTSDGLCFKCASPSAHIERKKLAEIHEHRLKEIEELKALSRVELGQRLENFFITTENVIDLPIEERIEVIFSEYVYGLNIIKDLFSGIRDIVGGRVGSVEKPLRDTNEKIIEEMKNKAIALGGDAVIGLNMNYNTGGGFISVVAVGTVVKLKK